MDRHSRDVLLHTDHHAAQEKSTRVTAATAEGSDRRGGKQPSKRRSAASSSGHHEQVKKSRICKFDGCTRYVVNRGLCIGHGVRLSLSLSLWTSVLQSCHILTTY